MVRKDAEKKEVTFCSTMHKRREFSKCANLVNFAETCKRKSQAPARPGRMNKTPRKGQRKAAGPSAGAGTAAGVQDDYTVAGRGSAAMSKAARPCWEMMEMSRSARASTAERSGSSAGACCFRNGNTAAPSRPRAFAPFWNRIPKTRKTMGEKEPGPTPFCNLNFFVKNC